MGDAGMLASASRVAPVAARGDGKVDGRVDSDVVSRFATCCRALGIAVYERQRPADLAAARSGFTALARIAHDQCDAWTGLAAAGDVSLEVLEAVSRTADTAGALQRQVELSPGALGFRYDTGLYLQFRATSPDDFQLAYAAALAAAGRFADAHEIVAALTESRPGWREARWIAVVLNYRAERWSDVVKLLTPIVNDAGLDEAFSHAARIALGTALARLGMFAPALSYLEEPDGPSRSPRWTARSPRRWCCARTSTRSRPAKYCRTCTRPTPRTNRSSTPCPTPVSGSSPPARPGSTARTDPWDPATEPSPGDFVDPAAHERKAVLLAEAERQLAEFIGLERSKTRWPG